MSFHYSRIVFLLTSILFLFFLKPHSTITAVDVCYGSYIALCCSSSLCLTIVGSRHLPVFGSHSDSLHRTETSTDLVQHTGKYSTVL